MLKVDLPKPSSEARSLSKKMIVEQKTKMIVEDDAQRIIDVLKEFSVILDNALKSGDDVRLFKSRAFQTAFIDCYHVFLELKKRAFVDWDFDIFGNEFLNNWAFIDSMQQQQQQQPPRFDFLGADIMGKRFLLGSYGKGLVNVETMRGKMIGICFASLYNKLVPSHLIQFYNTLKATHHGESFEMIFVVVPPNGNGDSQFYNLQVFNHVISFVPFPIVHFADHNWRSLLLRLFGHYYSYPNITLIDTKDDTVRVLQHIELSHFCRFGPQLYPFTIDRLEELELQYKHLPKKTSILAILGSESRDYLIDRHFNQIPISSLQDKDVLLYVSSRDDDVRLIQYLGDIYNFYWSRSFEIVSIPLDYNGGPQDEKIFNDSLAVTPWLSLPFGDVKTWSLRIMMQFHTCAGEHYSHPIFFIKPKGKSRLDPYGCHVIKYFGIHAYPFTRRAAAHALMMKQKTLTFKSFLDEAQSLGLNFNHLIQNKSDGKTEEVYLQNVMVKSATKGLLLFFASLENCPKERLDSLVAAYKSQTKSSSSFEVIFISIDKDIQSFRRHFSAMPWFAFREPVEPKAILRLTERTVKIGFLRCCHFLAFAPAAPQRYLLKAGLVAKSFEKCDFPFISDAESTDHLLYCITSKYGWSTEADGSYSHADDVWTKGLVENYDEEDSYYRDMDADWDGNLPVSVLE